MKLMRQPRFTHQINFVSYFFQTIRNLCTDYFRHRRRQVAECSYQSWGAHSDLHPEEILAETSPDRAQYERLEELLPLLGEKYRSVLTMTVDGYKSHEIAQSLNRNEGTIRRRRAIAICELKRLIHDLQR